MLTKAEKELVEKELSDDLGRGDLYSRINDNQTISAVLRAKQDGVFAGEPYVKYACFLANVGCVMNIKDGERFKAGDELAVFSGNKSAVLIAERTALNFAQHASGIATKVAAMKALMGDSKAALLDTRKTRPGLRVLEKYAIRCGGGQNHRLGLDDVVMLKDTHFLGCDDWAQKVASLRAAMPFYARIEIECDTMDEFYKALKAGADAVLLDAFSPKDCAKCVQIRNEQAPFVLLEASGNIDEHTIADYAASGVDAISSGANIHQAVWIDMSLRVSK